MAPLWLRFEFLRDLTVVGGGDLRRGDCGQTGVVSPEATAGRCCIFGSFDTASVTGPPGCSCGTFVAERARWMAAAERTVPLGVGNCGGRCGLVSWLFCLLLSVGTEGLVVVVVCGVSCAALTDRIGDVFLDVCGLLLASMTDGCFRSVGTELVEEACRIVTGLPSLLDLLVAGLKAVCTVTAGVGAGSALSVFPLIDRNPSRFEAMTTASNVVVVYARFSV